MLDQLPHATLSPRSGNREDPNRAAPCHVVRDDQIATVLTVRVSMSWRTWAYRRGLRAEKICRAARMALAGCRTVMTGTLLGVRREDHTSSGNSLTVAGTVITGMVDMAESVGPAPFERPM